MKLRIARKVYGPLDEDETIQDNRLSRYRHGTVATAIRRLENTAEGREINRWHRHLKELFRRVQSAKRAARMQ